MEVREKRRTRAARTGETAWKTGAREGGRGRAAVALRRAWGRRGERQAGREMMAEKEGAKEEEPGGGNRRVERSGEPGTITRRRPKAATGQSHLLCGAHQFGTHLRSLHPARALSSLVRAELPPPRRLPRAPASRRPGSASLRPLSAPRPRQPRRRPTFRVYRAPAARTRRRAPTRRPDGPKTSWPRICRPRGCPFGTQAESVGVTRRCRFYRPKHTRRLDALRMLVSRLSARPLSLPSHSACPCHTLGR